MSVIASLVALTVIQGFSGISKGIIAGRFKSLATQLANEMMQSTKSTPYYQLRVSSQTVTPTGLSSLDPPVLSDEINYPPVDHVINGVHFTRYMYVQRVQKNASENLEVIGWNAPDSGLKQITLSVLWREREEWKQVLMVNLLENPNRMASNGDFIGYVKDVPLNNIPDVLVEVAENTSLNTLTDASGNYRLGVPVGTYTLRASKRGYFPITTPNRVVTSTTPQVTVNFTNLTAMSSGTVSGTVWHNDHLVISRVCGAKMDGGTSQEYVEIFNPTTWTWTVDGQLGLSFQRTAAQDPVPIPIQMDYTVGGNAIAPGKFFLFGSHAEGLTIDGVFVGPDAGWADGVGAPNDVNFPYFDAINGLKNILPINGTDGPTEGAGVLSLYVLATGAVLDKVGWQGGGFSPGSSETAPIPGGGGAGMEVNKIYYRKSDVGGSFSSTIGPAYDSGNNALDWGVDSGAPHTLPRTTLSPVLPVKAGTPSQGAFIFANDGLSVVTQASMLGSPPEARFTLPAIATGTWTVSASTGNYFLSFSTPISAGVSISTSLVLNTSTLYGFASGYVRDAVTSAGINAISVTPGAGVTNAAGFFSIALSPGAQTLQANPNSANPNYTGASQSVIVSLGQTISGNLLFISPGGRISGRVTIDGTNPLPNIPVEVTNKTTGVTIDTILSGTDGSFTARVPVGTFKVQPVMAHGEAVSPITLDVIVPAGGSNVFAATYTVTSAFGTLEGTASALGKPISTGVLIVASTSTVPANPPDLNTTFQGTGVAYYAGASRTDGSYSFSLKNGTYTVAGWYTTFTGNTPTVTRKSYTGVVVNPNQNTTLDIPWQSGAAATPWWNSWWSRPSWLS